MTTVMATWKHTTSQLITRHERHRKGKWSTCFLFVLSSRSFVLIPFGSPENKATTTRELQQKKTSKDHHWVISPLNQPVLLSRPTDRHGGGSFIIIFFYFVLTVVVRQSLHVFSNIIFFFIINSNPLLPNGRATGGSILVVMSLIITCRESNRHWTRQTPNTTKLNFSSFISSFLRCVCDLCETLLC